MKTASVSGKETGMDSRSQALASAQSVHNEPAESVEQPNYDFSGSVLKPDAIATLWESADPNMCAQKLVLDHFDHLQETNGTQIMAWDDNENRYESNELKWIASFLVESLCFVKTRLGVEDQAHAALILDVFWRTLHVFGEEAKTVQGAMSVRYTILQNGIKELFANGVVKREQVAKMLDYLRRTLFAHMQLYTACLDMKKQETKVKKVAIFAEVPQVCDEPDLETNCKEILEVSPETALDGAMEEDVDGDGDGLDDDEIFDPNDPLYGLDERLANMNLTEETRAMLRSKLIEASKKITDGLENRQKELDTKLQAMPPGKKK